MSDDFREFLKLEEENLVAQLRGVRTAIRHGGEKGRVLEESARSLLRRILPAEYGLGTGFIACATSPGEVELSPQLDLIIYDAVRGGALLDLGSCGVYPLEVVHGVVEVKTSLYEKAAELFDHSAKVRRLETRHYLLDGDREVDLRQDYDQQIETMAGFGGPTPFEAQIRRAALMRHFPPPRAVSAEWMRLRYFAIAFEYARKVAFEPEAARTWLEDKFQDPGHLHAVLVPGICTGWNLAAHEDASRLGKVQISTEAPLAVFRRRVLAALSSFPRPSVGTSANFAVYFGEAPEL